MGKRIGITLGLLLACGTGASSVEAAVKGRYAEVRKQIESSLLVKGTIDIRADGTVATYALDKRQPVPESIVTMIDGAVPKWRFEPLELRGNGTVARAEMSMRVVARKLDDDNFAVEIRGAQFHQPGQARELAPNQLRAPRYPDYAVNSGVGGTVYLVLKIGRDGRVQDAVAEQVNLRVISSERDMAAWRDLFAKASLKAAKAWTFNSPPPELSAEQDHWSVRVPVDFVIPGQKNGSEGRWEAYGPGPRQKARPTFP